MKQQVPQEIYEDSRERVIAHYDQTMAYPYGNDLGYVYGCNFTAFEFTKEEHPNTFRVDGELEVMDKSQEEHPSYRIVVQGTVTTNFFRNEWSADWTLLYQDLVYETQSYSDTSTPAISTNQFRNQLTTYNGEYIEPHIPSESGGFTEDSGHVEVTVSLEAIDDYRMTVSISVFSFSDSARIAEVSASGEVEMQPTLKIEFDDDGWGNKCVLYLLFLENGNLGVWSEITEYDSYANWGLDIEYRELARTSSGSQSGYINSDDNWPDAEYNDDNNIVYINQYAHNEININHKNPVGYFERYTEGGYSGGLEIVGSKEDDYMTFNFYLNPGQTGYYGYDWVEPDFTITTAWLNRFSTHVYAIKLDENTYANQGLKIREISAAAIRPNR